MQKKTIIKRIRKIIAEHGEFSTADVQASSSPVIASIGKNTHQLAERFNKSGVDAVTYVHEQEVNSESIAYEDLPKDALEEILMLADNWEADELKTEKRISN